MTETYYQGLEGLSPMNPKTYKQGSDTQVISKNPLGLVWVNPVENNWQKNLHQT